MLGKDLAAFANSYYTCVKSAIEEWSVQGSAKPSKRRRSTAELRIFRTSFFLFVSFIGMIYASAAIFICLEPEWRAHASVGP